MKALIIADDEVVIRRVSATAESSGYDVIVYRWFLKALDNMEEVAPHLVIISIIDYPRHWKTLAQFASGSNFRTTIILYTSGSLSAEEMEKAAQLGIRGTFPSIDDAGLSALRTLLTHADTAGPDSSTAPADHAPQTAPIAIDDSEDDAAPAASANDASPPKNVTADTTDSATLDTTAVERTALAEPDSSATPAGTSQRAATITEDNDTTAANVNFTELPIPVVADDSAEDDTALSLPFARHSNRQSAWFALSADDEFPEEDADTEDDYWEDDEPSLQEMDATAAEETFPQAAPPETAASNTTEAPQQPTTADSNDTEATLPQPSAATGDNDTSTEHDSDDAAPTPLSPAIAAEAAQPSEINTRSETADMTHLPQPPAATGDSGNSTEHDSDDAAPMPLSPATVAEATQPQFSETNTRSETAAADVPLQPSAAMTDTGNCTERDGNVAATMPLSPAIAAEAAQPSEINTRSETADMTHLPQPSAATGDSDTSTEHDSDDAATMPLSPATVAEATQPSAANTRGETATADVPLQPSPAMTDTDNSTERDGDVAATMPLSPAIAAESTQPQSSVANAPTTLVATKALSAPQSAEPLLQPIALAHRSITPLSQAEAAQPRCESASHDADTPPQSSAVSAPREIKNMPSQQSHVSTTVLAATRPVTLVACSLMFTNPVTGALVTGSAGSYDGETVTLKPDQPQKSLGAGTQIDSLSLQSKDTITAFMAEVVSDTDDGTLVLKLV